MLRLTEATHIPSTGSDNCPRAYQNPRALPAPRTVYRFARSISGNPVVEVLPWKSSFKKTRVWTERFAASSGKFSALDCIRNCVSAVITRNPAPSVRGSERQRYGGSGGGSADTDANPSNRQIKAYYCWLSSSTSSNRL